MQLPDIQTEQDVRVVVDAFYDAIDRDLWLGRFFEGLDMPAHLPKMYAFWSSVVFQTGTYRGRPFDAHLRLEGLTEYHFSRWVERFHATVDAYFHGAHADTMKAKATQIATIFQVKLGLWGASDASARSARSDA
jgi:hemoglobin